MEDAEEVAVVDVVVDLRPLALGEDVLDVERVPPEPLAQLVDRVRIELLDVDPGQAAGGDLSDVSFARARLALRQRRPGSPDAGQARHWY